MFYIYILYSPSSNKYYVGYSSDVARRFIEHNETSRDSYTSKHRPWELRAIFLAGNDENEAIRVERFIKAQKSRKLIELLIDSEHVLTGTLAQLVIP